MSDWSRKIVTENKKSRGKGREKERKPCKCRHTATFIHFHVDVPPFVRSLIVPINDTGFYDLTYAFAKYATVSDLPLFVISRLFFHLLRICRIDKFTMSRVKRFIPNNISRGNMSEAHFLSTFYKQASILMILLHYDKINL
jgi:hypothetical protein